MARYLTTWEINPDQKPDLHFDDWHQGLRDSDEIENPQYPNNKAYMMGWYEMKGMNDGYAAKTRLSRQNFTHAHLYESYLDGYQDARYERSCH